MGGSESLRVAGFPRLLVSYTANQLGDAVALVALTALVYEQTRDPLATTALFLAAKFLPAFLAPALIARVDQMAVRRILPLVYLGEAIVFAALAASAEAFALWLVLGLALVDGTLALAARGLTRGAVAAMLSPRGLLREGNAALNLSFGLATVAGLAAGGLIVSESSIRTALLIDAGSFLAVAALLATSRHLPAGVEHREPFGARLRAGLAHVGRDRLLRALVVWQAIALVFFTLVVPIEVVYARETLGVGNAGFGALLASWAAGIVLGSLLFIRLRGRDPRTLVVAATAAVGLGYSGMAAVDDLVLACAFSVLGGLGNGIQWVSVMTLLQEATPPELQARVAGLLESVGAAMPGVGFVLGGVVTTLASPPLAFAIAGGGALLLAASAAVAAPRLRPS